MIAKDLVTDVERKHPFLITFIIGTELANVSSYMDESAKKRDETSILVQEQNSTKISDHEKIVIGRHIPDLSASIQIVPCLIPMQKHSIQEEMESFGPRFQPILDPRFAFNIPEIIRVKSLLSFLQERLSG